MAGIFNPIAVYQAYLKAIPHYLAFNIDEVESSKIAAASIQHVVYACLVGLFKEVQPALVKYNHCLQVSVAKKESSFFAGEIQRSYAISSWMINNQNNTIAYQLSLDAMDAYFSHGWIKVLGPDIFNKQLQKFERNEKSGLPVPDKEILKSFVLCDYLADCIQCGEYSRGAELYERVGGKPIANAKTFKTELALGYWICKQKMQGLEIPTDEYLEMGERVLRHNLEGSWLGYGQSVRAAIWLKIVYWHSGMTKTPLEVILKAYDVMPNVEKPSFV
jgi:hypothetical protein